MPDRACTADVLLDRLRITRIGDFSCACDRYLQGFRNRDLGVSRASCRDFDCFSLKTSRL